MKQEFFSSQTADWCAYQRMRVRLAGRLSQELARSTGLSEADFEILVALIESPDETVRALALRCGLEWEKSRLSHQLRRMEQRGLVAREDCAEDNRGTVVRITDAGRRLAEEAKQHYEQAVQRYVGDVLTAEQLEALGTIAKAVLAKLEGGPHPPALSPAAAGEGERRRRTAEAGPHPPAPSPAAAGEGERRRRTAKDGPHPPAPSPAAAGEGERRRRTAKDGNETQPLSHRNGRGARGEGQQ